MRRALVAICMAVSAVDPAAAYCSEPSAPSCATRYGSFDDEDDFASCRRQMTNYKSEVETFRRCQADAADDAVRAANAANDEYSETVRRFNRRARGE